MYLSGEAGLAQHQYKWQVLAHDRTDCGAKLFILIASAKAFDTSNQLSLFFIQMRHRSS
jgi:hypothetical protein